MLMRDEILKFFSKYIETELGIVYSEHNSFQLQNRLEEIAKAQGIPSIEELFDQAKKGISGTFKQLLLDVATNNETSFFRDPRIFKAIEEGVLKNHEQFLKPGEKFRAWSAASSSGQEALSLAILIKEFNERHQTNIDLSLLGSDISERILDRARTGTYNQIEIQRGLSDDQLKKYFRRETDERWTALPDLKRHIEYRKINLKSTFGFSDTFHLILCRNILIYQNVEGKADIMSRITASLAPGGYLVLGAGESLLGLSNEYEQKMIEGAILYQKKGRGLKAA